MLITKFLLGAWIAIAAMIVLFVMMKGIRRHYDGVSRELVVDEDEDMVLPSRNHAIVLVSKIHKPTMRAVAYARAMRPSTLEAVTVSVDPEETRALQTEWDRRRIPIPLKVLDSPFREVTDPIIDYVRSVRRGSPRDLVTVLIPEYVVGHWWEHLLHNQSALRLKGRLLFTPGVMVTSVPWQLQTLRGPGRQGRRGAAGRVPARRRGPRRGAVLSARPVGMSAVGRTLDVEVGPVAHGGHCVARHEGRVLFVRHALPGERVRVVVTDGHDGSAFLRADAVEVLEPSPDRVEPPCPWAGPGRCGGCDWQHASLAGAALAQGRGGAGAAQPAGRPRPRRRGRGGAGRRAGSGLAHPGAVRRRRTTGARACAGTGRTRWCRSTTAGSRTRWSTRPT